MSTTEYKHAKIEAATAKAAAKAQRPFYKKKRYWLLAIVALFVIIGVSSGGDTEPVSDSTAPAVVETEDKAVEQKDEPEPKPEPEMTSGQERALAAAENYLSILPQSQKALSGQLEFDGFSKADAQFAAENVEADWNEQATKAAENYLDIMPQSKAALIDQLEFDGFTPAQAQHGANAAY